MWGSYYKLCASDSFRERWVEEIGTGATPVFFQFVTDKIMEHLISLHFSVVPAASVPPPTPLDHNEKMALRYMGGK